MIDLINIGASVNDGTGDTIRNAFAKVNNNFTTLKTDTDTYVFTKKIVVNQDNVLDTLGGVIDSTAEYFIDGNVNIGSTQINVPNGGIFITGYNFEISGISSAIDNYTLLNSIDSGNVFIKNLFINISGANSKVYDLTDTSGLNGLQFSNIKYLNCTDLGTLNGFNQGLETNTVRLGGSPSLTFDGTWSSGYRINASIVRQMDNTTTIPLFKAGATFVMNSRFKTDINVDLGSLQPLCDFSSSNFANSSSLQFKNAIVTRQGITNPLDTNLFTNITETDVVSEFKNNVGLKNTFVGGMLMVDTQATTTITTSGTFYDIAGTFIVSDLSHFDSPSSGQLRHLGVNPIEFRLRADLNIDAPTNTDIIVRVSKWDDLNQTFEHYRTRVKPTLSLEEGTSVAFFTIIDNILLNQNDYVKIMVGNNSNTSNITVESESIITIEER